MDKLVEGLGPAFAAGFALQQLLEILDPLVGKIKVDKKLLLGVVSLVLGLALSFGAGLSVLQPLGVTIASFWDTIITGLIISAGTEGINSIMKFLGYTKDNIKEKMKTSTEH
ncbi:MAG: hypothetical protein L0Z71_05255 [Anaerolineae bacterium]|nr:hypothetical protein [Anaerolineae bacterium]